MTKFRTIAISSAFLLGSFTAALANPVLPGGVVSPDVFFPTATTLAQSTGSVTAAPLGSDPGFTDSYTVGVSSDTSNVFCKGCLDFYYYFTNKGSGINERFSVSSFTGFSTDVGYVGYPGGPGTHNPVDVTRSGNGSIIGFEYTGSNDLTMGQTTSILVVETNATSFQTGTFSIQDGVQIGGLAYEPLAAAPSVPEPASLALFGTGLLGVVGIARRKFNV